MRELMVLQQKLESATATPAVINFPVAEAKALVMEYMKKYENVVYSDDVIKQVKDDKKELNKIKKSINDFGIKTDKELSSNIKAFRNDLKDLIAMIDEPMEGIEVAIEEFEQRRKREKQLYCENLLADRVRNSDLLPKYAEKIELKERYLLVSESNKAIEADIMAQIAGAMAEQEKYALQVSQIEQQVEMANMKHQLNVQLKASTYLSMLEYRPFDEIRSLIDSQALEQKESEVAYAERIKAEEERKAEECKQAELKVIAEKQAEEQRIKDQQQAEKQRMLDQQQADALAQVKKESMDRYLKAEAERKAEIAKIEQVAAEEVKKAQEQAAVVESVDKYIPVQATEGEKILGVTLCISGTKSQLQALKDYLAESGMEYTKL